MSTPEHDYAAEERVRGAAQELLAALKALLREVEECSPEVLDLTARERAKAHGAINRAEGR